MGVQRNTKYRQFDKKTRLLVFRKSEGRCVYCGLKLQIIDSEINASQRGLPANHLVTCS